jgi:hypothetical protein
MVKVRFEQKEDTIVNTIVNEKPKQEKVPKEKRVKVEKAPSVHVSFHDEIRDLEALERRISNLKMNGKVGILGELRLVITNMKNKEAQI